MQSDLKYDVIIQHKTLLDTTYLGETLLLEVRDDALSQEIRGTDNVQHFFVIVS